MKDRAKISEAVCGGGGAIDALYDVRVDIDGPCRDALDREWTSLLDYHDSLPGGSRDFRASVRQMQMENPLAENPILDRVAV